LGARNNDVYLIVFALNDGINSVVVNFQKNIPGLAGANRNEMKFKKSGE
jgi:hypothetical protein